MMIPKSCSSAFQSKQKIQANVFIPVLSLLDSKCTQFVLKRTKKNPEPLENTGVPGFDLSLSKAVYPVFCKDFYPLQK